MSGADFAVPSNFGGFIRAPDLGLTKREYFAAMAMQGMCASDKWSDETPGRVARLSVDQADALIAALKAKPQP